MRQPGGRSHSRVSASVLRGMTTLAALVVATGCASERGGLVGPACPSVAIFGDAVTANPTNVLSAVVTAHVHFADSVVVRFGAGAALDSVTPAFPVANDSVHVTVLGLLPQTTYRAQIIV